MSSWRIVLGLLALLAVGVPAAARAQDDVLMQPTSLFDSIDEVRVGGAFHRAYPTFIISDRHSFDFSRFEDLSFEVLFKSPDIDAFSWIGSPRPNVGATISLTGRESLAHLALTWHANLFSLPIYLEGSLGVGASNGYLHDAPAGFANLGCPVGFYTQLSAGVDLPNNMTATVTYEHMSNNGICHPNNGITNVDLKLGWKF